MTVAGGWGSPSTFTKMGSRALSRPGRERGFLESSGGTACSLEILTGTSQVGLCAASGASDPRNVLLTSPSFLHPFTEWLDLMQPTMSCFKGSINLWAKMTNSFNARHWA